MSEMGVSGEGKRKREGGEVEVREGEGREKKRRMG